MLPDKQPTIRVLASERDVTVGGGTNIFGGWLLSQADIAGAICSTIYSRGPIVTASVDKFSFIVPVRVGDILSVYAEVTSHKKSSMNLRVDGYVQRDWGHGRVDHAFEAHMVFVAVDAYGQPRTQCFEGRG